MSSRKRERSCLKIQEGRGIPRNDTLADFKPHVHTVALAHTHTHMHTHAHVCTHTLAFLYFYSYSPLFLSHSITSVFSFVASCPDCCNLFVNFSHRICWDRINAREAPNKSTGSEMETFPSYLAKTVNLHGISAQVIGLQLICLALCQARVSLWCTVSGFQPVGKPK